MADKYYAVGQGKVYMATRNSTGQTSGFVHIGDADSLEIAGAEETLTFNESMSGLRKQVVNLVTSTDMSFTLGIRNIDAANLAKAYYGTTTSSAGATVSGETIVAYNGAMTPLKFPGVSSVTVTKTSGSTPLVAGTDYTLDAVNGTITILPGSTVVPAGAGVPCTVNYTYAAYAGKVEALVSDAQEYVIRFEGKTQFDNKAQIYTLYRAKPGIAAALALIGTDVGVLELTGALLPAQEISSGSQYFTIVQV